MDYNTTLLKMMDEYPSLFPEEINALEHLFFVNGNGYEWENGELVSHDKYNTYSSGKYLQEQLDIALNNAVKEWMDTGSYSEFTTSYVNRLREQIKELTFSPQLRREIELERRIKRANDLSSSYSFTKDGEIRYKMYPICEYADIMNIPSDIKPDWLEAAKKAIKLAFGPRFKLTKQDRIYLLKVKNTIKKIKNGKPSARI